MSRLSIPATFFAVLIGLSQHAAASRVMDEASIDIDGERRRYFHLHEQGSKADSPVIVLIDGSGCGDFSRRLAGFFADHAGPLNVYFLEKPHVQLGAPAQPETCSPAYERADRLERRVADLLSFLENEPRLKQRKARSIALLDFSKAAPWRRGWRPGAKKSGGWR